MATIEPTLLQLNKTVAVTRKNAALTCKNLKRLIKRRDTKRAVMGSMRDNPLEVHFTPRVERRIFEGKTTFDREFGQTDTKQIRIEGSQILSGLTL